MYFRENKVHIHIVIDENIELVIKP